MATWLDTRTVERVGLLAIAKGTQQFRSSSLRYLEWDISGTCAAPKMVELRGRPTTVRRERVLPHEGKPMHVDLLVKCRKCDPCLKARKLLWMDRARMEYASSGRTWFLTFTNRPDVHAVHLARARQRMARQGLDYDALAYDDQFILRAHEMSKELTKLFKRLRKAGAKFRYLAVTEMHKNGLPHLHVLLHETDGPIRKATIERQWLHGFSQVKLVETVGAAVYVTKYLAKTTAARVRASLSYGSPPNHIPPQEQVSPDTCKNDPHTEVETPLQPQRQCVTDQERISDVSDEKLKAPGPIGARLSGPKAPNYPTHTNLQPSGRNSHPELLSSDQASLDPARPPGETSSGCSDADPPSASNATRSGQTRAEIDRALPAATDRNYVRSRRKACF